MSFLLRSLLILAAWFVATGSGRGDDVDDLFPEPTPPPVVATDFAKPDAPPARGAAGAIHLPPGFRAELVYRVPLNQQGSWVALCVDERGRLIASDQYGALYRVTPSPLGASPEKTRIEPIPLSIGQAQGLLAHGGKLYVMMNGMVGAFTPGLYLLSDGDDADDMYDAVEQLRVFEGAGEHGPHAVILGPDGKSLYLCCGNATRLPLYDRSLVPPIWREDQLLPRLESPGGSGVGVFAPGGFIARTNLAGAEMEIVSIGYRNHYDLAFNDDGELFTYESDMEWDVGSSWYRPTRLIHAPPGSDLGWRGGDGKWLEDFPDTWPAPVNVGPGSPTGLTAGRGLKFPPRYQRAIFGGDWSLGNIYAFHLAPHGASYRGVAEQLAWAMPLAVTDLVVRPQDGALYFAVGGRKSESALYRIVWEGTPAQAAAADAAAEKLVESVFAAGASHSTAREEVDGVADAAAPTPPSSNLSSQGRGASDSSHTADAVALRKERHALESLFVDPPADVLDRLWPALGNSDRFVRGAARTALELQGVDDWRERALAEWDPQRRLTALVALARCGEKSDAAAVFAALSELDESPLGAMGKIGWARAAQLALVRLGPLEGDEKSQLAAAVAKRYPSGDPRADRLLAQLLAAVGGGEGVATLLAALDEAVTPEEQLDLAAALSVAAGPWTPEQFQRLLVWMEAAGRRGGTLAFLAYLGSARDRFIALMPLAERRRLAKWTEQPLIKGTNAAATPTRPFVREWKLDEAIAAVESAPGQRDLVRGRRMFAAATCFNCHRFEGEGSMVGPDLTGVGRRFGLHDLLRAIVEPNHEISDQYRQTVFQASGRTYVGRVTNLSDEVLMICTDMLNVKDLTSLRRAEIESEAPSDVSMMPAGLIDTLSAEELADLVEYLRGGSD